MYKIKNVFGILICIVGVSTILYSCKKSSSTTILGNWVTKSEFNGVGRSEAVSFVINNEAYIGTGFDGTYDLNDVWQYDPVQNNWIQKADFPGVGRSSAVAFTVNNKGYLGTGIDAGKNKLKDFWQYDPVANSWLQKANFGGSARYDAVGFAVLNKGYVSTGYDGNYLKDFWQYNDATDTWAPQVSMGGFKRLGAVAFVHNNKAYICTGNNNGSAAIVNDMWMFDPTANPFWTQLRGISIISTDANTSAYTDIVRTNAVAFVMGDYAYLTTGENGAVMSDTWRYDFANDLWTPRTPYEGVARTGAIGFSVNDSGYVATGRSGNSPFDDIREFFPDEPYNAND